MSKTTYWFNVLVDQRRGENVKDAALRLARAMSRAGVSGTIINGAPEDERQDDLETVEVSFDRHGVYVREGAQDG